MKNLAKNQKIDFEKERQNLEDVLTKEDGPQEQVDGLVDRFLSLFPEKSYLFLRMIQEFQQYLPARELLKILRDLIGFSRKYYDKYIHRAPTADKAKALHSDMDAELSRLDLTDVSCGRGCSSCCYWKVEITDEEAELLANEVIDRKIKLDWGLLKEQILHDFDSPFWKNPGEQTRCIFLSDDSQCQVYDSRPMACRKCFVTSDPIHCATVNNEKIDPLVVPEGELLTSVAWSTSLTEPDLLPRKLWRALNKGSWKIQD